MISENIERERRVSTSATKKVHSEQANQHVFDVVSSTITVTEKVENEQAGFQIVTGNG